MQELLEVMEGRDLQVQMWVKEGVSPEEGQEILTSFRAAQAQSGG